MIKKVKLKIGNVGVSWIKWTARKLKIDLLRLGYWENGILKSHSLTASGERYLIECFLKTKLGKKPVLFDVGANIGEYTQLLAANFPEARIYSFEPNPNTFPILEKNSGNKSHLVQKGIGNEIKELELHFDTNNPTSVQASSDPEIIRQIAKTTDLEKVTIQITTLDAFCSENKIEKIDLLKIDTEGFELEAIEGAAQLLAENRIEMIQFEFNEVNIIKRRFLKDFYDRLNGFDFFRLDENKLIPLNEWQPIHEIFMFQNILAIRK